MDTQSMRRASVQREACILPRSTSAPALARGFVSHTLASWDIGDGFCDAELLASELVTNAVRHANGDVALSLQLDHDRMRVAVGDSSAALPVMGDINAAHDGGWGLHIVDRLASCWGLDTDGAGKTVWCEIEARPDR